MGFAAYYDSAGRVDLMDLHKDEKPVFISARRVFDLGNVGRSLCVQPIRGHSFRRTEGPSICRDSKLTHVVPWHLLALEGNLLYVSRPQAPPLEDVASGQAGPSIGVASVLAP